MDITKTNEKVSSLKGKLGYLHLNPCFEDNYDKWNKKGYFFFTQKAYKNQEIKTIIDKLLEADKRIKLLKIKEKNIIINWKASSGLQVTGFFKNNT